MSFFFNAVAGKPKQPKKIRVADIPVTSLRSLGCSVCPRDKDSSLQSPKMKPSGRDDARIYLLGSAPSEDEDEDNMHWTDKAGSAVYRALGSRFVDDHVRSNFITQCRGDQTAVEIECCRPRIVADIEAVKPLLVVTIGDAPLNWALGGKNVNALVARGSVFVTTIGKHECWLYPILYPNFVHKKKTYGRSEYELTLEHDAARIRILADELLVDEFEYPRVWTAPYDAGVEIITGSAPGDLQRLDGAFRDLAQCPRSAVDVETTGLRPFILKDARVVTASVGTFERTVAFAVDHEDGWGTKARVEQVKSMFFAYLRESGRKAAHNLSMELEWFAFLFGDEFIRRTEWDDTMAMAHTFDERPASTGLDYQCRKNFGFWLKAQSPIDVKRQKWWLEYPLKSILKYNGMDTKWTNQLRDTLEPQLDAEPVFRREYERKLRLAPTLVKTEVKGLAVDFKYAQDMADKFNAVARAAEAKLKRLPEIKKYEQQFGTFQPTNPDHVLRLFKEVTPCPEIRVEDRDGKVRWTTEEEALAKIKLPSAALILEHRGAEKLVSTYIEPILTRKIVCRDDRVRGKYSSMLPVTGRLACEDPNVMNWPKRKHKEIRGIICTSDWFAACDYGQIEFRVVGMASEDKNLVKYCWTGYDVHKFWAERMIAKYGRIVDWIVDEFDDTLAAIKAHEGSKYDEDKAILKTLRQEAKNKWVFPQLFGASVRMCAEQLHLPEEVAEDLGAEFWDEFPGVKRWQEKVLRDYEKNLYVETLGGRRRRGPQTKNEIINLPIQGTAADIVTAAMDVLSERADLDDDPELQPVLNVHDDLTFELCDASLDTKLKVIASEMCLPRFDYVNVPLIVEVSVGSRWHDLHEIKVYKSHELFNMPNPYV